MSMSYTITSLLRRAAIGYEKPEQLLTESHIMTWWESEPGRQGTYQTHCDRLVRECRKSEPNQVMFLIYMGNHFYFPLPLTISADRGRDVHYDPIALQTGPLVDIIKQVPGCKLALELDPYTGQEQLLNVYTDAYTRHSIHSCSISHRTRSFIKFYQRKAPIS